MLLRTFPSSPLVQFWENVQVYVLYLHVRVQKENVTASESLGALPTHYPLPGGWGNAPVVCVWHRKSPVGEPPKQHASFWTLNCKCLKDKFGDILSSFFIVQKFLLPKFPPLTGIVCLLLWFMGLHPRPETIKKTSASLTLVFFHCDEHTLCSLSWAKPHIHHPAAVNANSSNKCGLCG